MGSHYRFKSSRKGFKKTIPKAMKTILTEQENPKSTEFVKKLLEYPKHLVMPPSRTLWHQHPLASSAPPGCTPNSVPEHRNTSGDHGPLAGEGGLHHKTWKGHRKPQVREDPEAFSKLTDGTTAFPLER